MRYKHNKSSNKSAYTPTDENYGLTSKEAKLRLRKHGPNIIFDSRQEKASKVFFKLFYDPVSLLLLVCSLVMFTYNDIASSLLVVFIWLAHNTITLLIYYKSHQIMSTVKSYGIPKCKVLRDGKLYLIDSRLLVVGDIVYIGAGDIICADCNILSSSDLYVYEHDVTGKDELSHKYASDDSDVILLSDMHGSLFASSSVVRGSAVCTVIATADDTEIVSGAGLINIKGTDHSDLFFDIKKKCRRLGISSIIIALSLFLLKIVLSPSNIFDCFLIVVALIASSMIETLLPLSQIVCSRYIYGAATDKRGDSVVIKNPGAIDALRELDTILITDEFIDRCDFDIKKELPLAIKIIICSEGKKAFSVASKYYLPVYKDIFEFFTAKDNICVYPISDYSDRIELLDKLHKNGKKIGLLTNKLDYIRMLDLSDVAFTYAEIDYKTNEKSKKSADQIVLEQNQILSRISDVLCNKTPKAFIRAIQCALSIFDTITDSAIYLMSAQSFRCICAFLGVILDKSFIKFGDILLSGMIIDLLVVLTLSYINRTGVLNNKERILLKSAKNTIVLICSYTAVVAMYVKLFNLNIFYIQLTDLTFFVIASYAFYYILRSSVKFSLKSNIYLITFASLCYCAVAILYMYFSSGFDITFLVLACTIILMQSLCSVFIDRIFRPNNSKGVKDENN